MMASPDINELDFSAASGAGYGMLVLTLTCLLSTCSSIYIEFNYKKTEELSIFYQNMLLYTYGLLVNYMYLLVTDDGAVAQDGMFYGFDAAALHTLLAQATMGIVLSFIFKFLDNIIYVISLTVSMLVTAGLSIMFFEFQVTVSFFCALVIITGAIYLFYRQKILERFGVSQSSLVF